MRSVLFFIATYCSVCGLLFADDLDEALLINMGYGPQPGSSQINSSLGLDYEFYRYRRSQRQVLSLGASYTYLATDYPSHSQIHAISIYPQLSLYFSDFHGWRPWFFVRALAPTYLSDKQLGDREQAQHFAFQAQVGLGLTQPSSQWMIAASYKHFSNANLWQPNDGIDIPLVLNIGKRF